MLTATPSFYPPESKSGRIGARRRKLPSCDISASLLWRWLPVENPTATAIYPDGVPDCANVTGADRHLVVQVGKLIEDRVQRQVKVLPAASDD
jgi:hypothetical protein